MPKIPGTFDYSRYEDLRLLLPKSIQEYYQKNGTWDRIVLVKFYEESDVVWTQKVPAGKPKYVIYIKHKWGYRTSNGRIVGREIKSDDWQQDPPRGARLA